MTTEKFSVIKIIKDFSVYSTSIFILFLMSIIVTIINFKNNKVFSLIVFFHIITFLLIYKNPHPRIFTGFYCFYIFMIFDFIRERKILFSLTKNKHYFWIFFITLIAQLINFEYLKKTTPLQYKDFNFTEDKISRNYLKVKCKLINENFSEIQKRNFYFNYINVCNQKFNLNEFLKYYRS